MVRLIKVAIAASSLSLAKCAKERYHLACLSKASKLLTVAFKFDIASS